MTSFFLLFFTVLLVTSSSAASAEATARRGEADPPLAGGTRCPQRVGKVNAALPPKFDFEQRFAGNARRNIAHSAIDFGIRPRKRSGPIHPWAKRAKVETEADLSEFHPPAARIALNVPLFEDLSLGLFGS
jgi:hypothetical protein